ncbi:hypothetical protein CASFOL_020720 [Castilleja foliolosa]|uniref:Uncharacterized protein n=1 Tax=Castilleja foliolosa TaxID=1961234 RepID=A0ABD3D1M7_9LAMI
MTMKENSNPTLQNSNFVSKEIFTLNGLRSETDPLVSEEKDWKPKFDEFSMNNYGPLYPPNNRKDKMPIASFNANELKDTKYLYTNKNISERDKLDLTICDKDVNYHVVKDICIDEGASANELKITKSTSESPSDETLSDDDSAAEDSFVDETLPIQEFGTRSFLRSLIDSLDSDERHKEISSGNVVSMGPTKPVAEAESKKDIQAINSLSYNSKVESQIITFNFNSPALVPPGAITNRITEKVNEQTVDSTNAIIEKVNEQNVDLTNAITEKVNEHSVDSTNEPDQSVHCDNSENTSIEKFDDHHDADSAHVLRVNNESVVNRENYEHGESSFSAASGFVVHSGPIPYSGSVSFRSDVSATSGRSFAFPVLQSEWNSSPVRMTKANGGHFRKHKFWRSGLLCCRF